MYHHLHAHPDDGFGQSRLPVGNSNNGWFENLKKTEKQQSLSTNDEVWWNLKLASDETRYKNKQTKSKTWKTKSTISPNFHFQSPYKEFVTLMGVVMISLMSISFLSGIFVLLEIAYSKFLCSGKWKYTTHTHLCSNNEYYY